MKKYIFLTLALALAFAGTAWGQTTEYFQVTTVSYAYTSNPFVYDGTAKTYITYWDSNCSINDGEITGNTATNAGSYTATISSQCYGHGIGSGSDYYEEFHVGSVSYNWTILPRNISKTDYTDYNVSITVHNQKWTGSEIELAADVSDTDTKVYSIKFKGAELVKGTDYDVYTTIESSTGKIKDEGRYTIVFVGKGNFTGTVTKTIEVKKDMSASEATTGIHFVIPEQILANGSTSLSEFNIEVLDKKSHATLHEGEDYTLKFYTTEENANNDTEAKTLNQITAQGKYFVAIYGVAPKYDEATKAVKPFYLVNEYQTTPAPVVDGITDALPQVTMRITKAGYPDGTTAPEGTAAIRGEMVVSRTADGNACIDVMSERCSVSKTAIAKLGTESTSPVLNYNVVGIKEGAFAGCAVLRWLNIDIAAETWTPGSLDRTIIDSPFAGVPKMALVYLFGNTVTGENYVYKFGTSPNLDYRCAQYRIYEDLSGQQTQFSE
jgi:hypothetical protein